MFSEQFTLASTTEHPEQPEKSFQKDSIILCHNQSLAHVRTIFSSKWEMRNFTIFLWVMKYTAAIRLTDCPLKLTLKCTLRCILHCMFFFLLTLFFKGEIQNYIYIILCIIQIQSFVLTGKPQSYKYFPPIRITLFFFYFPCYLLLIK